MAHLIKRNSIWYIRTSTGAGKKSSVSTGTENYQLAKAKLRETETAQANGEESPLATKTPIPDVLTAYVKHVRATKTAKSAQCDIYVLRDAFGPVCDALKVTSRKLSPATKKRPPKAGQDRRRKATVIDAPTFEQITTAKVSSFITGQVASRGLAPKSANRIREVLTRLVNWSMTQNGIRMPGKTNPAAQVERLREGAPVIEFLTMTEIDQQLAALEDKLQLQVMVAVLIYAGLRREELLWLTHQDIDLAAGNYGVIRVQAKNVEGESWMPKTKVNRAVPVSSTLRPYLDRWRMRHREGTWVFPSPQGVKWDPDNFSSDLRSANEMAKLRWGCLHFRHSFGSHLAMANQSLFKISKLMGNSPEICRRHYAHLLPESLTDSVEFTPAKPVPALQHAV